MTFKTFIAILVAFVFSGCFGNTPEPCAPIIIKEPFEVKIPIKCVHPVCDTPILYVLDKNSSYTVNAKYMKANDLLKSKHIECLQSSISTCEGLTETK